MEMDLRRMDSERHFCRDPELHDIGGKVTPQPKVVAGGVAGALTIVLVWVAGQFGLDVPPEVASAFTVLVSFAAGYLKAE